MGIVFMGGVLLLLCLVLGISRTADHRLQTAAKLEVKIADWYIATGEVRTLNGRHSKLYKHARALREIASNVCIAVSPCVVFDD